MRYPRTELCALAADFLLPPRCQFPSVDSGPHSAFVACDLCGTALAFFTRSLRSSAPRFSAHLHGVHAANWDSPVEANEHSQLAILRRLSCFSWTPLVSRCLSLQHKEPKPIKGPLGASQPGLCSSSRCYLVPGGASISQEKQRGWKGCLFSSLSSTFTSLTPHPSWAVNTFLLCIISPNDNWKLTHITDPLDVICFSNLPIMPTHASAWRGTQPRSPPGKLEANGQEVKYLT